MVTGVCPVLSDSRPIRDNHTKPSLLAIGFTRVNLAQLMSVRTVTRPFRVGSRSTNADQLCAHIQTAANRCLRAVKRLH